MKRTPTLDLLIDLERRERDRAATEAARTRRDTDAAASTLDMLVGYRADHHARTPKLGERPFTSAAVRVHEAFSGRLDQAIGEQGAMVDRLATAAAERDRALIERQRRLKALETLAQRRAEAAQRRAQRAEQRQTDEFAIQAFLRSQRKGSSHD